MTTQDGAQEPYFIGLAMAGAISAGAYTAGVLDVLFAALDRHNARFVRGKAQSWRGKFADYPRHRVVLRVISGTSAGGVSAGLAVAGLLDARRRGAAADGRELKDAISDKGDSETSDEYKQCYRYLLKPLHEVWVKKLSLLHKGKGLLSTEDLDAADRDPAAPELLSLLNMRHVDRAAEEALSGITPTGESLRFLSRDLDVFLTTTNLQGVPYTLSFPGSDGEQGHTHTMLQHSTIRHFRIREIGEIPDRSDWLEAWQDDGIALRASANVEIDFSGDAPGWPRFRAAAIATGAFPVGLAAQVLVAGRSEFGRSEPFGPAEGGAWPINIYPKSLDSEGEPHDMRPQARMGSDSAVRYTAVDGGVANNEPFEYARYTLRKAFDSAAPRGAGQPFLQPNPRDADKARCSVIMIDPFPEGARYEPLSGREATASRGVPQVIKRLLPALIQQARFKPGELLEASSQDVHSRYLIAPSRRETTQDRDECLKKSGQPDPVRTGVFGADAIASGSFGGFGGFLDESFRVHDYVLGQRNAYSFLQNFFSLPVSNPVLNLEEANVQDKDRKVRIVDPGDAFFVARPALPVWPRVSAAVLAPVLAQATVRIRAVGFSLTASEIIPQFIRRVQRLLWKGVPPLIKGLGERVSDALSWAAVAELIGRDQHEGYRWIDAPDMLPKGAARAIIAAIAASGPVPVPVALSRDERATPCTKGVVTGDLLGVLEMHSECPPHADAQAHALTAYLNDPRIAPLLWRAPRRPDIGDAYTLEEFKPNVTWAWIKAIGARLRRGQL